MILPLTRGQTGNGRLRILVYEHCSTRAPESVPTSWLVEGRSMLVALLQDLASAPGIDAVTLLHRRQEPLGIEAVRCVASDDEPWLALDEAIRDVDGAIVIAPETGGLLQSIAARVEARTRLIGPPLALVSLFANKERTALQLGGLTVPTTSIDRGWRERLAGVGDHGWVVKPIDGAGALDTIRAADVDQAVAHLRRQGCDSTLVVSPFMDGQACSVAIIGRSNGPPVVLEPMKQVVVWNPIECEPGLAKARYVGGSWPLGERQAGLVREAARRFLRIAPPFEGYVGLDLVTGESSDADAVVIEVNPRLTTSYIALRRLYGTALARSLIDDQVHLSLLTLMSSLSFTADGVVAFHE